MPFLGLVRKEDVDMRLTRIIAILLVGLLFTFTACASPTIPPNQDELSLQIVSVTSPVSPGANATLVAQTISGANCDIDVYYKSGASTAQGLYPKTADSSGRVSWTWKVGTRTTPGNWQIVVKASYGGKTVTQSTYFTVR